MPRYKLLIEYDGTNLVGWQRQAQGYSVQGLLEDAVQHFAREKVTVCGAGRTDAGVHALGQVAHLDIIKDWTPFRLQQALNHFTRDYNVAVLHVVKVDQDFHARFSALHRSYVYRIVNRYAPLAIDANRVWRIPQPLDIDTMQRAAHMLLGTHDFSSFRAQECQAQSPVKTLDCLDIHHQNHTLEIYVKARSFLHHQVRNMVGALSWVGLHHWTLDQFTDAFLQRDRRHGAPTAPACGLYFLEAAYPG